MTKSALTHALICFFLAILTNIPSFANEPVPPNSNQIAPSTITDSDKSIIKRSNDPVWFDSNDGTIRPIGRSRFIDVEDRHDSIARPAAKTPPSWWSAFRKNLGDLLAWLFQGWHILLIVCFVTLLIVTGLIVFYYVLKPEGQRGRSMHLSRRQNEKAKIQDLPFEVEMSMLGLLSQAERYRAAGDFSKAIIYLFSYALVEMDGARLIRLERGKTNRVYLGELRGRDSLRSFTSQVILAFEYAFFGKHVLSKEMFEPIWQQLPAFEAYLKQSSAAPSGFNGEPYAGMP